MEHQIEEFRKALKAAEEWQRSLEKLVGDPEYNSQGQVEELENYVGIAAQTLLDFHESLSKRISGDDKEPLPPAYQSIPELRTIPWKTLSDLKSIKLVYPAVVYSPHQPAETDLDPHEDRATKSRTSRRLQKDSVGEKEPHQNQDTPVEPEEADLPLSKTQQRRKELPERVRINSVRLNIFLDYNVHDSTLAWSSYERTPLCFLRPYKFLVWNNAQIRAELKDMERIRYERQPRTEVEYDNDWKTDSPEDECPAEEVKTDVIPISELTALIKDLRCLVRFMDEFVQPTIGRVWLPADQVFFSDLWNLYPSGSLIYVKNKKVPQKIWKVVQRTGGRRYITQPTDDGYDRSSPWFLKFTPFVVDCFHIDYDGTRYVRTYETLRIEHFEGSQPVISLPFLPLQAAEDEGLVDRKSLLSRAQDFVKCTRASHREYVGRNQILRPNGSKLNQKDEDLPDKATRFAEWIESEVMVDFERALQEMPAWRPAELEPRFHVASVHERLSGFQGIDDDNVWDLKGSEALLKVEDEKFARWDKERTHPTEEQDLLLLPERVFAFVFRTRKWACLQLGLNQDGKEMLKERKPRLEPWDALQLPSGHKRLVQSLVETHSANKSSKNLQFDLVRAKGKGVIILLHGVPGVGKTSTAECAAEANKKPLLPITCGDLGATPKEVEKKLEEAFQFAQLWGCVLLLDEADIFLAQRTENDVQRNALVSVFLRVLEYYEGVLFLTTNRVGVFDEAFKSRIHMALYYPPLEWRYTKRIWETHLRKLTSSSLVIVDGDDILEYAEDLFNEQIRPQSTIGPVWNGRQIRNAFQSAVALAGYKHQGGKINLERRHFEDVSKVSNEFNRYVWSIKSQSDADKAEKWGYRLDQYQPDETVHMKNMRPQSRVSATDSMFPQIFQPSTQQSKPAMMNNHAYVIPQQSSSINVGQPQDFSMRQGTQFSAQSQVMPLQFQQPFDQSSNQNMQQLLQQQQIQQLLQQQQQQQQQSQAQAQAQDGNQQQNFPSFTHQHGVQLQQGNVQLQSQYLVHDAVSSQGGFTTAGSQK